MSRSDEDLKAFTVKLMVGAINEERARQGLPLLGEPVSVPDPGDEGFPKGTIQFPGREPMLWNP